jgi:NADPH:quinone reductase
MARFLRSPHSEKDRLKRFVAGDIIAAGFRAVRELLAGGSRVSSPLRIAAPVSVTSGMEATAIILTRCGGPEVLEARKILVGNPGPGEARIRQTAVGVNFIDVYCRRGSFDLVTPSGILGMEAAGIIESIPLVMDRYPPPEPKLVGRIVRRYLLPRRSAPD